MNANLATTIRETGHNTAFSVDYISIGLIFYFALLLKYIDVFQEKCDPSATIIYILPS